MSLDRPEEADEWSHHLYSREEVAELRKKLGDEAAKAFLLLAGAVKVPPGTDPVDAVRPEEDC